VNETSVSKTLNTYETNGQYSLQLKAVNKYVINGIQILRIHLWVLAL
jgi:hypothetical protein